MRAFRRIQISANVFKTSRPNSWVKEQKSAGTGIVGEEENVTLDEDLEILEFIELEHPQL